MINFIKNLFLRDDRTFGAARSSQWPRVEKEFLKTNPTCALCLTGKDLNVHHIMPFHLDPTKELDPTNLITLCRHDHFLWGHFQNWSSLNPSIHKDVDDFRLRVLNRKLHA